MIVTSLYIGEGGGQQGNFSPLLNFSIIPSGEIVSDLVLLYFIFKQRCHQ